METRTRKGPNWVAIVVACLVAFMVVVFVLVGVLVHLLLRPQDRYVQVQLSPQQTMWIHVRGREYQVADRRSDLAAAPLHRLARTARIPTPTGPPIFLLRDAEEAGAADGVYLSEESFSDGYNAARRLTKRDASGVTWRYLFSGEVGASTAAEAEDSPLDLSGSSDLTLDLMAEPQAEGEHPTIAVSLDLSDDYFSMDEATREGKNVLAHVKVKEAKGKVVATKADKLSAFGST